MAFALCLSTEKKSSQTRRSGSNRTPAAPHRAAGGCGRGVVIAAGAVAQPCGSDYTLRPSLTLPVEIMKGLSSVPDDVFDTRSEKKNLGILNC